MTRAFPLVLFLLATAACTKSPYERGLALGREHAELLRDEELTFEKFTRDLDEADEDITDAEERREFRRGYSEGIEPMERELTRMIVAKLARDTIDDLGTTAAEIVASIRATFHTPDGKIDREKIRELGRELGRFLREVKEGAEELHKGAEEGFKEER